MNGHTQNLYQIKKVMNAAMCAKKSEVKLCLESMPTFLGGLIARSGLLSLSTAGVWGAGASLLGGTVL